MPFSKFYTNQLIDAQWRAGGNSWWGLLTSVPDVNDAFTELSAAGYARVLVVNSLAEWSGTQGAGTTAASSGTTGQSSNNNPIVFSAGITANWSGLVAAGRFSAVSGGNLLDWCYLVDSAGSPVTRNFVVGDPVSFAAGALRRRLRNTV